MKKLFISTVVTACCLIMTACSTTSVKYEQNDPVPYKRGSWNMSYKIYCMPAMSLQKENPRTYAVDLSTEPELRRELANFCPEMFCVERTDDSIEVQHCTRWYSKTTTTAFWQVLSFLTFGLIPYLYEQKDLHRIDFILPDGTMVQQAFTKIHRIRGCSGILGIFQHFRLLPDLPESYEHPYKDPGFLSTFTNGISHFERRKLQKYSIEDTSEVHLLLE